MTDQSPKAFPDAPLDLSRTMVVLLADGKGSGLHELTARECKPAIPFMSGLRIVDFTMANAVRSGLGRMIVATQFCPGALHRHLATRWQGAFPDGGLQIHEGCATTGDADGYRGTAAAVWANAAAIDASGACEVVVLAADHIYAMDYRPMIAAHRASGCAVTVAADRVLLSEADAFGIIAADSQNRIIRFLEKPPYPPAAPADPRHALASMGIWVFDWAWLRQVLAAAAESATDFGQDILPQAVEECTAQVFRRSSTGNALPYWRDLGTLDAFRRAYLDFDSMARPFHIDLKDDNGCQPLQAPRQWSRWTSLNETVVMPGARVASGARLSKAIIAPGAEVPAGMVIGEDPDEDARWFRRTTGGTILVTRDMLHRRATRKAVPHAMSPSMMPVLSKAVH